jgi:hypothetical protein
VNTGLLVGKETDWGRPRRGMEHVIRAIQIVLGRSVGSGALPILYQATDPCAQGADYIGPSGKGGHPAIGKIPPAALDQVLARRLWEISEKLAGVQYGAVDAPSLRIREAG